MCARRLPRCLFFRPLLAVATALAAAACGDPASSPGEPSATRLDPAGPPLAALVAPAPGAEVVPDRYIVAFRDSVADVPGLAQRLVAQHRGAMRFTYRRAIKGFAAQLPPGAVASLRQLPQVAFIEPVTVSRAGSLLAPPAIQTGVTAWGIDRVDQRDRPLSGTYTYTETGEGVRVYIVDSGIDTFHPEFSGRARNVHDVVDGNSVTSGTEGPCTVPLHGTIPSGHGTHVAGTAGGVKYGIAKEALLLGVRVLYCDKTGTTDLSVAGLDWVAANAVAPAVVNFSMMHAASLAVDQAAERIIDRGFVFVTIATNSFQGFGGDACQWSPARVARAITVASSNRSDSRSSWSGYGACVDLFAPGEGVLSALPANLADVWNGTSMAAPHVAGTIARYLERRPAATVAEITDWLRTNATPDRIVDPRGSPNLLLHSGVPASAPPPAPVAVVQVSVAPSLTVGQTTQATATATDAAGNVLTGRAVTWATSNAAVATVSATGLVTAVAPGSATITATSEGRSGSAGLTVTAVPVASVTVTLLSPAVVAGQTTQATATLRTATGSLVTGRAVAWSSSNTAVATVSSTGLVTAVAPGTAAIRATSEGVTGSATATILARVATVTISGLPSTLRAGATAQATVTLRDAAGAVLTGRPVTWSSSNTAVASVSASGLVTAVSAGSVTIRATSEGQTGSAPMTITVPAALPVPSLTYRCHGRWCDFDASASTGAVSHAWDYGDGTTGSGALTRHDFPDSPVRRSFTVTLTVRNSDGVARSSARTITCDSKRCS